jgi:hypothetical protein
MTARRVPGYGHGRAEKPVRIVAADQPDSREWPKFAVFGTAEGAGSVIANECAMILGALAQRSVDSPRVNRETPEFQRDPSIKEIETWDTI